MLRAEAEAKRENMKEEDVLAPPLRRVSGGRVFTTEGTSSILGAGETKQDSRFSLIGQVEKDCQRRGGAELRRAPLRLPAHLRLPSSTP